MQPILDHLKSRYLNTNLHRTWLDENNYLATFPLWNLSNQLVGYQKYNPKGDKKHLIIQLLANIIPIEQNQKMLCGD
mgnify:CR=1 FL=1